MKEMTTREVQLVCLELLKDVHEFCIEHDIHYSLSGGSLIGAIRHNGFIPWDDDADIQMPRPDFDRFIKTYKSKRGFQLYAREKEDGGNKVYSRVARVFEIDKTYVDQMAESVIGKQIGVWIDIIPVDGAPGTKSQAIKFMKEVTRRERLVSCLSTSKAAWSDMYKFTSMFERVKFCVKKIIGYFISNSYVDNFVKFARQYDYNNSSFFYATPHYGIREWQPKEVMNRFVLHKFEDTELFIMAGYDANLKSLFGDYMQMPPKDKQVVHEIYKRYWKLEMKYENSY